MDMPFVRRWLSRGLDGLAIVVVLYALFHFFVQPRLIREAAEPAPPVALAALDGGRFSLAEHRGRVVFLDFWASWCAPCKQSLPLVEHYARAHPDIDVVAINVGESAGAARAYARQTRLANVVLDPDEIAAHAYGVNGFPTMVVVDPAGMVRAKWIGYDPAVEQAMADARRRYGKVARATAPFATRPLAGVRAWIFDGPFGRSRHVDDAQVLFNCDRVVFTDRAGSLVDLVLSDIGDFHVQAGKLDGDAVYFPFKPALHGARAAPKADPTDLR